MRSAVAHNVLRDLAPVLTSLGDQIKLVLPKSAGPFNVDVDAGVSAGADQRGRLRASGAFGRTVRIDLADGRRRRFVARYANVRQITFSLR